MADRPPIRYAIYTRQSNQGLFDFSSCDAQFLTCQDHVKQLGEPGLLWTGQHFKDEDYSGSTLDRPGMHELRKMIEHGELDRVYPDPGIGLDFMRIGKMIILFIPLRSRYSSLCVLSFHPSNCLTVVPLSALLCAWTTRNDFPMMVNGKARFVTITGFCFFATFLGLFDVPPPPATLSIPNPKIL